MVLFCSELKTLYLTEQINSEKRFQKHIYGITLSKIVLLNVVFRNKQAPLLKED